MSTVGGHEYPSIACMKDVINQVYNLYIIHLVYQGHDCVPSIYTQWPCTIIYKGHCIPLYKLRCALTCFCHTDHETVRYWKELEL